MNSEHGISPVIYARGRYDGLLLLLLAVSLAGNLLFGYLLFGSPQGAERRQAVSSPLPTGTTLPPLRVQNIEGESEMIEFGDASGTTILYVFTPTCLWCARNLNNVRAVSDRARQLGIRLVGLSLDSNVQHYVESERFPFSVFVLPDDATREAYGLGVTPQTFVISPGGVLVKEWRGAFAGEIGKEVEEWLGTRLPGLAERGGVPHDGAATKGEGVTQ